MNVGRLSLLLAGVALLVLAPGSFTLRHAPATTAWGAATATRVAYKASQGTGAADSHITRTQQATQNTLGGGPPAPPAKKSKTTLSGPYSCDVWFDNHTAYYIQLYVDGNYYGTVAPWGDFTVYNVGTGQTQVYARANFANTTTYYYWGPASVACTPYLTFHETLYL